MEQEQAKKMNKEIGELKEKIDNLNSLVEQLLFPNNIEEAWQEYESGDTVEVDRENLKEELKKW